MSLSLIQVSTMTASLRSVLPENVVVQPGDADRERMTAAVRAELRRDNQRLTEHQVDLIAEVAVELRLTRVRLFRETDPPRNDLRLPSALSVFQMQPDRPAAPLNAHRRARPVPSA
jgi:hypothetical protein